MSSSFKMFGEDFSSNLISLTSDPFVALFIGILVTSIVQSSSFTTSLVVGLVASGCLTLGGAIPIVLGANIGTTVTNTITVIITIHIITQTVCTTSTDDDKGQDETSPQDIGHNHDPLAVQPVNNDTGEQANNSMG